MELENCPINTFTYKVTLPQLTAYTLQFLCDGNWLSSGDTAFSNINDALVWVTDNWGSYGTWSVDGNTLILSESSCSSGAIQYTFAPTPQQEGVVLTDTGEQVDRNFWGVNGEILNFVSDGDINEFDIFDVGFCNNVDLFAFEFLCDWGAAANHYGRRFNGDRPNLPPPTPNGGYNVAETCNEDSGNNHVYTSSFWAKEVSWCLARGMKMMLNCNLNDFDTAAYIDNAQYTDAQVGLVGFNVFNEYKATTWCNSPLNGDTAAIIAAANTLITALKTPFPSKFYTRDWRDMNVTTLPSDAYSLALLAIGGITGTRLYMNDATLMSEAELSVGRTPAEYLSSIINAIASTLPNRISVIKTIAGTPIDITSWYSANQFAPSKPIGYAGTYNQCYFFARMLMKFVEIEATTPHSINYALLGRLDFIGAKTTLNKLGQTLLLFKNLFTAGRNVYLVTLPSGLDGIASSDGAHGTMVITNPTANAQPLTTFKIGSTTFSVTNINAYFTTGLDGTSFTKKAVGDIPAFAICEVLF